MELLCVLPQGAFYNLYLQPDAVCCCVISKRKLQWGQLYPGGYDGQWELPITFFFCHFFSSPDNSAM
jgi:hypothetical protein